MKKVLIVDDTTFMRNVLRTILENSGFEVIGEAENGAVGVKRYEELNPDVVTMDITMPEMDGISALKEIKKINSNAKVIMISSMGQEAMIREAVTAGAKSFVVKPFNQEIVIKTLTQVVGV